MSLDELINATFKRVNLSQKTEGGMMEQAAVNYSALETYILTNFPSNKNRQVAIGKLIESIQWLERSVTHNDLNAVEELIQIEIGSGIITEEVETVDDLEVLQAPDEVVYNGEHPFPSDTLTTDDTSGNETKPVDQAAGAESVSTAAAGASSETQTAGGESGLGASQPESTSQPAVVPVAPEALPPLPGLPPIPLAGESSGNQS